MVGQTKSGAKPWGRYAPEHACAPPSGRGRGYGQLPYFWARTYAVASFATLTYTALSPDRL